MNPAAESDYGFQADNYTPAMRFRKDPNGNFWEPDGGGVAGIRRRIPDQSHRPGWTPPSAEFEV